MHLIFLSLILLGWTAVAGPILGAAAGKKASKNAGNAAQTQQEDLLNQYLARYHQQQVMQRAGIDSLAGQTNPFSQASQASHPYFSVAGQNTATFSPSYMSGAGPLAAPSNAFFTNPAPPQPTPQVQPPANNGWGGGMSKYFPRQQ